MTDIRADRALLRRVTADVRRHVPGIRTGEAWVNRVGPWHWDFYSDGAGAFHCLVAAPSAYKAKAKGWAAYLAKLGGDDTNN